MRKGTSAILAHPALILTPAFTCWTFGNEFLLSCSATQAEACCICQRGAPQLRVSFRLTWINALMTITGCLVWTSRFYGRNATLDSFTHLLTAPNLGTYITMTCPYLLVSLITLLLIQFLDKCTNCCCGCFKQNCLPMYEKVRYDGKTAIAH